MESEKTTLTMELSTELKQALENEAKEVDRSLSSYIRIILNDRIPIEIKKKT